MLFAQFAQPERISGTNDGFADRVESVPHKHHFKATFDVWGSVDCSRGVWTRDLSNVQVLYRLTTTKGMLLKRVCHEIISRLLRDSLGRVSLILSFTPLSQNQLHDAHDSLVAGQHDRRPGQEAVRLL